MALYEGDALEELVKTKKSIMLIGPAMSGKTYSLWTLIKWLKENNLGKLHLHDLDLKCESLVVKLKKEGLLDYLVVHRVVVPDTLTLAPAKVVRDKAKFNLFQVDFNKHYDSVDPKTGGWKAGSAAPGAIFIDSLSSFQEIVKEFVMADAGHDIGASGTDARSDFWPIMSKILETIKSLKELPCISGWIMHEALTQDALGNLSVLPNVIGKKFPSELGREFNAILYSTSEAKGENTVYKWQMRPKDKVKSAGVTSRDDLPLFIEQDFRKIL